MTKLIVVVGNFANAPNGNPTANEPMRSHFPLHQHHKNTKYSPTKTRVIKCKIIKGKMCKIPPPPEAVCHPRRKSEAVRLVELRNRIPLRSWTFVSCLCCVRSDLWDELITFAEESYRVRACIRTCV
jgi:hypothetical protein